MSFASMDIDDDNVYSRSKRLVSGPAHSTPSTTSSARDSNPATELLQDMIREKRAQTQRTKNTHDPIERVANGEKSTGSQRDIQSSPLTSASSRGRPSLGTRRTSGATVKPVVQKEMGLREMTERISKIDKQNIDLKLEIFHRRQRNEALEAKVEELEARETDFFDLQARFEALLLESDRQRLMLDDAVAQICELQGENESLQAMAGDHYADYSNVQLLRPRGALEASQFRHETIPFTSSQFLRKSASPNYLDRQDSVKPMRSTTSSRNLKTTPLPREGRNIGNGSHSIYSSGDSMDQRCPSLLSVDRPGSVLSGDEEVEASEQPMLNSPRLSILSESGFSSIYGSPKDDTHTSDPTTTDKSEGPSPSQTERDSIQGSAQRDARIDLWIQDKPKSPKSTKQSTKTSAPDRFTSIGQVLQKLPSASTEHAKMHEVQIPPRQSSSAMTARNSQRPREIQTPTKVSTQRAKSFSSSNGSISIGGKLPPTPDTMSTATIGGPNSSTQSIIAEKSLLDQGQTFGKGYANLIDYGRPDTSDSDSPGSTNTTRNALNGLGFGHNIGPEGSYEDEELRSTVVEQGDDEPSLSSPFVSRSMHRGRHAESTTLVRPSISTQQTDMFFNGEGFALVQPSRTFSYPASRQTSRQASIPLSPANQRAERHWKSSTGSDTFAQRLSPKKDSDAKIGVMTSSKTSLKDDQSILPTMEKLAQGSPLSNLAKQQMSEPANGTRQKPGRFLFFRRSNSHNADVVLNSHVEPLPRPQTFRATPFTHTHPRLPERGSSIGARPGTSDGSIPTAAARPSRSTNTRRHSAILDQASFFIPKATASMDHHRRLSETRPALRAEDSKFRWPLGRSASTKIKEGLGLKRS